MNVTIIKSNQEFEQLKKDWNLLNDNDVHGSIFCTWEWQYNWWCQYGKGRPLRILVINENDNITAILPLFIRSERFMRIRHVSILSLIGTGSDTSPDYLGLINASQQSEQMLDLLVDAIFNIEAEWDCLEMSNMKTCSGLAEKISQRCKENHYPVSLHNDYKIPYIKFNNSWDDYLLELSSNRRADIRRCRRKFESKSKARFYVWKDEENLSFAFDTLIKLHHKRWGADEESSSFLSAEYVSFHFSIISELFNKDFVRLCCLELDGKIIAMLYCYYWNKKFYYFQGGFDPDYSNLKPGAVLMAYSIEQAIKEGAEIFDMLKGDYKFKRSLAKHENKTWVLKVYKQSAFGKLMWLRKEVIPKIKCGFRKFFNK